MSGTSVTATVALLCALAWPSDNASASSRRDIASAHLACLSIGEPLAELRAAHLPAGVLFDEISPSVVRVGYNRFWFFRRWLCQLSVSPAGVVVASNRLP